MSDEQSLEQAYKSRLSEIGRENSPEGLLVLRLAKSLDAGMQSGSAEAALAGRLMAAWDSATAGAPIESGILDQIAKKRREKFGA